MSTRGVVAFETVAKWRGVYNGSDSYPSQLGARLWPILFAESDLAAVRDRLFHAGRVEAFLRGEVAAEREIYDRGDPIVIEWIYIVEIETRQLHVLASAPLAGWSGFEHVLVDTFPIGEREPDWKVCERKRSRMIAPVMLERIRTRFGEDSYRAARRQMLDED